MAADRTHDAHALREAVARIELVPEAHRRFVHGEADVTRRHGITPAMLTGLLDAGLPHRGGPGARTFDPTDLENAGLALRVGPRWRAMRWWSGRYRFDVRAGGRRRFGPAFAPLVAAATALRFHVLPAALSADLGFLRATGLADCRLATRHLTGLGAGAGLGVRPVEGRFVATPYAVWHTWVDFRTDDGWLAADPFLLGAFDRWGIIDGAQWPADRSPHGLLRPLAETWHAGRPAPSRPRLGYGAVR